MQREYRRLQGQANGDESRRDQNRVGVGHPADAGLHVGQVQGAGHHVDQADADQVEGGADGAHNQVLEHRRQSASVRPAGNQYIAGQRGDFHKHENIEGIGRYHNAGQARQRQQPCSVEQRLPLLLDLPVHTAPRSEQSQRRGTGDDEQNQRAERTDIQFNAVGGLPAAHVIAEVASLGNTEGHKQGYRKTE